MGHETQQAHWAHQAAVLTAKMVYLSVEKALDSQAGQTKRDEIAHGKEKTDCSFKITYLPSVKRTKNKGIAIKETMPALYLLLTSDTIIFSLSTETKKSEPIALSKFHAKVPYNIADSNEKSCMRFFPCAII